MADEIEIAFDIVDQVTVARLIEENPDLLPHISVDKAAVLHYNKSKLNNTILAGILQGETIPQMVANLTQSMIGSNLSTAYRSIRTAVTSAENGGRYARYQALEKSGVTGMKKQWLATGDSRTRESHMAINGETVDNSKPFSNGLMYPGDPNGTASEVYNCRCAMRMVLAGVNDQSAAQYRSNSVQLFQNWLGAKQNEKTKQAKEYYRRKTGTQGQEIIDQPTYNKLTKDFLKHGGIIIRGKDAERHLQRQGAYASYVLGGNIAFIRDDATISDVLEEMYHAEQDRTSKFSEYPKDQIILRREIDAQKYLLSVAKRYKIPLEEIEVTKHNLADYEAQLQALIDKSKEGK